MLADALKLLAVMGVVGLILLLLLGGGNLAETGISLEQEALIANHELMPGLTRAAAIDLIGMNWVRLGTSGWGVVVEGCGSQGGSASIDSKMTPDMVTASWGMPDWTRASGIGQVYVYLQPPDGELHVTFTSKNVTYDVTTVLYPAYFRRRFPAWTDEICALVAAEKVALGMTVEMALASWGNPSDVNRSVGSWGVHEQWVYRSVLSSTSTRYLYLEDGILTSWQD